MPNQHYSWNRFLVLQPPTITPAQGGSSGGSGWNYGIHTGKSFDPCVLCHH